MSCGTLAMLEVSGSVVLGVFGLVFTAVSILVGVVWHQQTHRIVACEKRADEDRKIYGGTTREIFGKVDETQQMVHDLRVDIAGNLVTNESCERRMEDCPGKRRALERS